MSEKGIRLLTSERERNANEFYVRPLYIVYELEAQVGGHFVNATECSIQLICYEYLLCQYNQNWVPTSPVCVD
jgi:hypothetical protein